MMMTRIHCCSIDNRKGLGFYLWVKEPWLCLKGVFKEVIHPVPATIPYQFVRPFHS